MNKHTDADLLELQNLGRAFKWNRPTCKNNCGKVWGHGFVLRHFEPYGFLWVRRWRCHVCRAVLTARPPGFWRRVQTSAAQIFQTLKHRLCFGFWPVSTKRQRAGHWLRKFSIKSRMDFPESGGFGSSWQLVCGWHQLSLLKECETFSGVNRPTEQCHYARSPLLIEVFSQG